MFEENENKTLNVLDLNQHLYKAVSISIDKTANNEVQVKLNEVLKMLSEAGFTIRTQGITENEKMVLQKAAKVEHYLPWKGFNESNSQIFKYHKEIGNLAQLIILSYSGLLEKANAEEGPNRFKTVIRMMNRDISVVLGQQLNSPVKAAICWTPDGCESFKNTKRETGDYSTVIRTASYAKIPVINLYNAGYKERITNLLNKLNFTYT